MSRLYSDYAYGPGPRNGCWWDTTIEAPDWSHLEGPQTADVAIIGGGFTGLSAALHLAEAGASVIVLEAMSPGWGASGRNGGFCCLGGAKIGDEALIRQHGADGAHAYWLAEAEAVDLVANILARHDIDVDRHSDGETELAHSARQMDSMRKKADQTAALHGVEPLVIEQQELMQHGMAGDFFGAVTTPIGFAVNPRKYLFGLGRAAEASGARLYQRARVVELSQTGNGIQLKTERGTVSATHVLIATNGYSSEDLPGMAGRYMPTQSNVMVTRPLTDAELAAQGWTSAQMAYDSRNLLHYFRLMPDRRFLFGLRGGLTSSPRAEATARRAARRDFEAMFPAWAHVENNHAWSGMVCLSRNRVPFVGPVPGQKGVFAGFAYHGNGVAMATYSGRALARLALGQDPGLPKPMTRAAGRFPLGRFRRLMMPPIYLSFWLQDQFS